MRLPIRPLHCVCILLTALFVLLGGPLRADTARTLSDQDIGPMARLSQKEVSGAKARLEFSLTPPADLRGIPPRLMFDTWVVGVPNGTVTATVKDAMAVFVNDDGTTSGTLAVTEAIEKKWVTADLGTVRLTYVDRFRLAGLYRLELVVTQGTLPLPNKPMGKLMLTGATIELDLGEKAVPAEGNPAASDSYMTGLLSRLVANPGQIALASQAPEPLPNEEALKSWNTMLKEAADRGPLLFARLPRGGLYRLQAEQLRAAGIEPENFPVDRIRIFCGADELAATAVKIQHNRLIGDGRLAFHVPEDLADRKPFLPLWVFLAPEGELGRRIPAPVSSTAAATTGAPARETIAIFEPNFFDHMLPMDGPQLRWMTGQLREPTYLQYEFTIGAARNDAAGQLTAWVTTLGGSEVANYSLYLNNQKLGEGMLRGRRVEKKVVEIPPGVLKSGLNTFAIQNCDYPDQKPEDRISLGFVAAEVEAPILTTGLFPNRSAVLDAVALDAPVPLAFRSPGKPDGEGLLADVSDPLAPRFASLSASGSGKEVFFGGSMSFATPNPRVIFSPPGTLLTPVLAKVSAPECFLETKPLDYIAIVHPTLRDALEPLLALHREKMAVEAVSIDDIYAAFSYGELRYEAIHDALKHFYAARTGDRLRHVLLVGEASEYWWEYRRDSAEVSPNMVPVFGWRDASQPIRGDDGFGQLQGAGPIGDVEIGRLSASRPEDLAAAVAKTVAYSTNPPQGSWLGKHLFVTDDEPEFASVAKDIIAKSFRGANKPEVLELQQFPYEDYFRGFWRKRSAVMTDKVIEEWNKGASTIAYLGHGGPNLWSGERILHLRDVERTNVEGRFPIMVAGSCDTGWVDYPEDPVKASLAESFLRSPKGGAVAAYIPIAGTSSFEHNYLMTGFYRAFLRDRKIGVGEVTVHSKLEYLLYRNNQTVTEQYLLMGDPALPVARAPENLTVRATPSRLLELTGGELSLSGSADGMDWGIVEVSLLDAEWNEVAAERLRIQNGEFSGLLHVPPYLKAGQYQLVVKAENESLDHAATVSAELPILPHRIRVEWSSNPPMEQAPEAGTPIEVSYKVFNDSEVDLTQAELILEDTERGVVVGRHPIRVAAGGQASRSFRLPLPPGINSLKGSLYFAPESQEGASKVTLAEGSLMLRGRDRAAEGRVARLVDFSVSQITLRSRTNDDTRLITMPLFDMTGGKLPANLFGGLRLDGPEGDRLGALQPLQSIAKDGQQSMTVVTTANLPSKEQPFAFELLQDDGETSRTLQVSLFNLDLGKGPDLEIVDRQLVLENIHPMSGKTIFVRFKVRNIGDKPATQVVTQLYLDEPWNEEKVAPNVVPWSISSAIDKLDPGEEKEMRMRWDHQGTGGGTYRLFATVSSRDTVIEPNMTNNEGMVQVNLLPPPNLAIDKTAVVTSRSAIRPYDRVTVTLPIMNDSPYDFLRDFKVTASVSNYNGTSRRIFRQDFGEMKSGESAAMQFDWLVRPGEYQINIDLNEDREYLEQSYGDNTMRLQFTYLFDEKIFRQPGVMWAFDELPSFGHSEGLIRTPGGKMTVANDPSVQGKTLPMTSEYLVEGKLGKGVEIDQLFGVIDGGLTIGYGEFPQPVKFHYKLDPADGTTYYDLLLTSIGGRFPERMSGHFRYRLDGEADWHEVAGDDTSLLKLGRIQSADNELTIEFAGPPFATFLHVWDLTARPVMGLYESPVIAATKFPQGPLTLDADTPGGSEVQVDVRYGRGPMDSIIWSDWIQTAVNAPVAPSPWPDNRYFQWRARAIATPDGSPSFSAVKFAMQPPDAKQVANR